MHIDFAMRKSAHEIIFLLNNLIRFLLMRLVSMNAGEMKPFILKRKKKIWKCVLRCPNVVSIYGHA